ncbi:hypothetical protein COV20_00300 [Candidatus Woesearchaeota archaeon CG10_big_fil_rev_8_21_14_0_10_45_16]|nr:MAG: hypothetical protein COV20_00300 [Candidatus Woesearchaeota archaeon CG10_big_fil_rev_8_21_14_0_10_45_16]
MVNSTDVAKLRFKAGKITAVKKHPKTSDYIVLVDIGKTGADKQVVLDLKDSYRMEELMGKFVVYVEMDEPSVVKGIESLGYVLIAYKNKKPVLIQPSQNVRPGAAVVALSNVAVKHR